MPFLHHTLLAAGSLLVFVQGAPMPSTPLARIGTVDASPSAFAKRATDVYKMYTGNGQSSWPGTDQWISSFDEIFENNRDIITGGCEQFHVAANSDQETNDIAAAIKQVSDETGVDGRFIFAVMMQESNGCVRAPTTNYGVRNPGLMQDHDGSATCNEHGNIQNPCPSNTIVQMIRDGVAGTPAGDGLVQTLSQAPGSGATKYYGAARIYNSGSIHNSGDLGSGIATHCYSSDIANRLLGWVYANKACSLDGGSGEPSIPVAPKTKSRPVTPAPAPAPATAPAPAPAPPKPVITSPVSQPAPAPVSSNLADSAPAMAPLSVNKVSNVGASAKAVSSKMAPGVTTECAKYYNVQSGDFCYKVSEKFSMSFDKFRALNTGLDAGCSNLWLGYDYCVKPL